MESSVKRKATNSKLLAFPAKKKCKFHGKRYSDEAKGSISKVTDWVKLAIGKQKRDERLILSETCRKAMCYM